MLMNDRQKIAQVLIVRLQGEEIRKRFSYYRSLVKMGIGGFILFGGTLKQVRDGIRQLQKESAVPLFISSDLERGLGQQIEGGTLFPHAMAIAHGVNRNKRTDISLLRRSVKVMAEEAKAVGINTIFSPVMDVNTNSRNPIICTRAFSDDPEETAWFGREVIKGLQKEGIIACAKHFPGHGDTSQDSHRELPVIKANMRRLNRVELYPFNEAVKAKVQMMMAGHLKVPAIDKSCPASLSLKTIKGLLRKKMRYKGLVVTDAMNMEAVSGKTMKSEGDACIKALLAGADILLHPSDPEYLIDHLTDNFNRIEHRVEESYKRIINVKKAFYKASPSINIRTVGKKENRKAAYELAKRSIGELKVNIAPDEKVSLLVIDDDDSNSGKVFISTVKGRLRNVRVFYIDNKSKKLPASMKDTILIAAVFSGVSAWKGSSGLSSGLMNLLKKNIRASKYAVVIGFCSPYILEVIEAEKLVKAYSATEVTQKAAGEIFLNKRM
jgi:beta-glucosidase-like glycosyl hydrolase